MTTATTTRGPGVRPAGQARLTPAVDFLYPTTYSALTGAQILGTTQQPQEV